VPAPETSRAHKRPRGWFAGSLGLIGWLLKFILLKIWQAMILAII
jgi:hypothetical protein